MIAGPSAGTAVLVRTGDRKLYHSDVVKRELYGIQRLRRELREIVEAVTKRGLHAVFTRYGTPTAVLVPIEWYRKAAKSVGDPTDL